MIMHIICLLLLSQIYSKTDLYVGYSDKSDNFKTVQEAVNKILKENETWREEDWNPSHPDYKRLDDDDEDDEKEWDSERYYEKKYGGKN
jgi:hypothetical protein